jgi:hypothetical protein
METNYTTLHIANDDLKLILKALHAEKISRIGLNNLEFKDIERLEKILNKSIKPNKMENIETHFNSPHWKSYGVFAIAIQLKNQNYSEIDVMWQEAIDLYEHFYKSDWNEADQSELECINKFMKHINQ